MKAGNRPLLFLDVDGPLMPIGGHRDAADSHLDRRLTPALARALSSNPLLYRLDARRCVDANRAVPALLHHVDPHRGLTRDDIDTTSRWLIHHRSA